MNKTDQQHEWHDKDTWYARKICPRCGYHLLINSIYLGECARCDFKTDNEIAIKESSDIVENID